MSESAILENLCGCKAILEEKQVYAFDYVCWNDVFYKIDPLTGRAYPIEQEEIRF